MNICLQVKPSLHTSFQGKNSDYNKMIYRSLNRYLYIVHSNDLNPVHHRSGVKSYNQENHYTRHNLILCRRKIYKFALDLESFYRRQSFDVRIKVNA